MYRQASRCVSVELNSCARIRTCIDSNGQKTFVLRKTISMRFQSSLEDRVKWLSQKPYVLPGHVKIKSPPIVYIKGEEMTRYASQLMIEQWVEPHLDISSWEIFDLSCKSRDDSKDQVLHDAVASGKKLGSIFKEPTITPSAIQVKEMGLKKALPSPNGAMRKGWNGISISRDTIHIDGIELGYKQPVLFDRHAVGGEYGAGWKQVGAGRLVTTFFPDDGSSPIIADDRVLRDQNNVVVTYHNPLDNVHDLAHHFFSRCLESRIVPYVVTKKTVFKWQEGFWAIMKQVFDDHYKKAYMETKIIPDGDLKHLISDSATMQIIRWTKGGFGMVAHNYDGDMLTDEIAQVHRSPGFITSNLIGKNENGELIKEFEASHGTVTDLWHQHLRGEETSFNPLGLAEALIGSLNHAADLQRVSSNVPTDPIHNFTRTMRKAIHNTFKYGQGTRDMAGPTGLTTEMFIDKVAWRLGRYLAAEEEQFSPQDVIRPDRRFSKLYNVDRTKLLEMFNEYDTNKDGAIGVEELEKLLVNLHVAPVNENKKQ